MKYMNANKPNEYLIPDEECLPKFMEDEAFSAAIAWRQYAAYLETWLLDEGVEVTRIASDEKRTSAPTKSDDTWL